MQSKPIYIYLLGLISGVAVCGSAYSITMAEFGFSFYYFALALFCALCVWVMDDKPRRLEDVSAELKKAIKRERREAQTPYTK